MIAFKEVTLDDQDLISDYFHRGQYQNSECTYTNLYIWRECYAVQWAIVEDFLIIKPTVGEETWILPPFGDYQSHDVAKAILAMKHYFDELGKPFVMRAITEQFEGILAQKCGGWFALEEERDLFDYLYNGEDLRELKGRKYHGKRNHLNNFIKNNPNYDYQPLTREMIPAVKVFLEEWCEQKACNGSLDEGLICEKKAIWEALKDFGILKYTAAVILIDGKIEAFTMGEMINDQTVVIHVEKANSAINGLYGAIHQIYLKTQWPDAVYVNREEDTGDEGLRKAKESYYPVTLLKKSKGVWVS